ncbi:MAG: DUF3035 domain-containing protein [Pseudomonadota bacterium]
MKLSTLQKQKIGAAAALLAIASAASGCSSVGNALGVGKNPPDEFAIVTKAPLVMPPDFALRPPRPGAQRPQERRPSERAQVALFGDLIDSGALTTGEEILLQKAGAPLAEPDIRKVLNAEASALTSKSRNFSDRVVFWRAEGDGGPPRSETAEKAIEEATGGAPVEIVRSRSLALPGVL